MIPLVLLGVLVAGALIAALLGQAVPPQPGSRPGSPFGESAGASPPAVPANSQACDVGEPYFRGSTARDGVFHGGGLGMPMPSGLQPGDPARMPFAFDVALLRAPDSETWAGVGAVRIEEPYLTPEQASSTVTACLARESADFHLDVTEAHFVSIPRATQAHERIGTWTQEGTTRDFRVLIADTGSPESLAVYVRVSRPGTPAAQALADAEKRLAKQ